MEAKHTPGPWEVDGGYVWPAGQDGLGICRVLNMDWFSGPVTAANASLIAAAPDLLKALMAVVRVADRKTDEFDMARAAIAKALGHHPTPLPDEAMAGEQEID